jgi:hypothetical protein
MILFNKVYAPVANVPFTRATKEAIWDFLKTGKTPVQIFKDHNVPLEDLQLVIGEIERLEAEVFSKIKGTWKLTDEVLNEDGSVQTPATYFQLTTRVALAESLPFVNVLQVPFMNDIITYYPTYNEERTFAQFVTAVQNG